MTGGTSSKTTGTSWRHGGYGRAVEASSPLAIDVARGRPDDPSEDDSSRPSDEAGGSLLRRVWRHSRLAVSLALLGAAVYFLVGKASEVAAAWHLLGHLSWRWVALGVLFEAGSMVVFARMQRWLLRAGGVRVPLRTMVEITVAGNAVAATLPGGVAWAGAWVFGQLRRRGVSRFLRVWMFLVAGALSSFALFLVVVLGIELAGNRGPVSDLRWAALSLAAIPVAGALVMAVRNRTPMRQLETMATRAIGAVRGGAWVMGKVEGLAQRVGAVRMSRWRWAEVMGLALLNWLYDCAVLITCLVALGISVPWRGIFVVYGLTQIAAAIPITPGGLGVVEGTMGALLHAYGVPVDQAVAGVIVYRIVSFWGLVPIGWADWVVLDLLEKGGRRVGHAHPWAVHRHEGEIEPQPQRHPRLLPEPQVCTAPACAMASRVDADDMGAPERTAS